MVNSKGSIHRGPMRTGIANVPHRLSKILLHVYEYNPQNFERLLGLEGVGPKTIRALSLISGLVYGIAPSFRDPARYSFAHGGKDRHPFPVDRETYDNSSAQQCKRRRSAIGRKWRL